MQEITWKEILNSEPVVYTNKTQGWQVNREEVGTISINLQLCNSFSISFQKKISKVLYKGVRSTYYVNWI